jgi:hypothetical protein
MPRKKNMTPCQVESCDGRNECKGYCLYHYRKWKHNGDANYVKPSEKGITKNTGRTHFKKGFTPWNKGLTGWASTTHMESLKKANKERTPWNKGKKLEYLYGENNWIWAGDKVSYRTLHNWVARHLGKPDTCEHCGRDGLTEHQVHWSNISGDYSRDLDDWQRLCAKCHKAYDKNLRVARTRG